MSAWNIDYAAWTRQAPRAAPRHLTRETRAHTLVRRADHRAQYQEKAPASKKPPMKVTRPTLEQWRSVRDACERFCGQGKYAAFPQRRLPPVSIAWNGDEVLHSDTMAQAEFSRDGRVVIRLRCSASPEQLHRSTLHELAHAWDHALIRAGWSRDAIEQRAEAMVSMLGSW